MRFNRLILPLLVLLVIGLVAGGLMVAGGPGTGRQERRDETRLRDLYDLQAFVFCVADSTNGVLPADLSPFPDCGTDHRLADPFTGTPYVYARSSDMAVKLCAGFEGSGRQGPPFGRDAGFEPSTGCLIGTYSR